MSEFIAPVINFAVVIFVLIYFARKPLTDFLLDRSNLIEKDIRDSEREAVGAKKLMMEWAGKWNGAEAHAKEFCEETKDRLENLRKKTLNLAKDQAERIAKEAELVGKSEITKMRANLQREIAFKSVQAAREFVTGQLSEKDRRRLVREYVEILGDGSTG